MLSSLRRSLDSWIVRGLFAVLLLSFVVWGIGGDMLRSLRGEGTDWAARVGSRTITPEQLTDAYHRQLAAITRQFGDRMQPTPEIRRSIAFEALQSLILGAAVETEEARLHVLVPQADIQAAILAIPQFRGANGQYDVTIARRVLAENNLTPDGLVQMIRTDVGEREVVQAVHAGAGVSDQEAGRLFAYLHTKRSADFVEVPFSSGVAPTPDEADLHRYYDNHPDAHKTPEYRHIKVVVLSAETVGKGITVSDDDLKKGYEANLANFVQPEKRSVQLITVQDEAKATALAAAWQAGAEWPAMQAQARADGGTAFDLQDAVRAELPSPALAESVFKAGPNSVEPPEHDELGWHVFRVIGVTPARDQSFEQAKAEIRDRMAAERAGQLVFDNANKLDNLLASGASMDEIPSDLGASGASGTVDSAGMTAAGEPAPIPGSPAVRRAVLAAAFAAHVGEPPRLQEVPAERPGAPPTYYAVVVDQITPPGNRPYDEVAAQMREDWLAEARKHAADEKATGVLTAVQGGAGLAEAAARAGLTVRRTVLTEREHPAEGFPPTLVKPLFSLKPSEVTMVQTADAFLVAVPAEIVVPDAATDRTGFTEERAKTTEAMSHDIETIFVAALRDRAGLEVNRQVVQSIAQ
jgi:peptidyl-prolyl cis-trans isomerase D